MLYKLLFHFIGRHLPFSYRPGGRYFKQFRRFCASRFLKKVAADCNIESGVIFGGTNVTIGSRSGIGVRAWIANSCFIGDNVM